jgi:hypothetical protein
MSIRKTLSASLIGCASLAAATPGTVWASDLSYTFLDFQALDSSIDLRGFQSPVPQQTIDIDVEGGDGVAVAGSLALPGRWYLNGSFRTSVIDFTGVVQSPQVTTNVSDTFDLVSSTLGIGYQRELADNFDLIAEVLYDSIDYDFGSLAGENFDAKDSGAGALVGFRWNPTPKFELYAAERYSPVGKVDLTAGTLGADTTFNTGVRWYFFEGFGAGFDFESGEVETFTVSMRFNFGKLPW